MVLVRVARLQKWRNAVLQRQQRRSDREQLVPGHGTIVRMSVQVAPLPDGRIRPASRQIRFGLVSHFDVVRRQFPTVGQIFHDVEQPVAHATREIFLLLFGALIHLPALAVVVDVDVLDLFVRAGGVLFVAQATLAVHFAVRRPGLVEVGADTATGIVFKRTIGDADARGGGAFGLADTTGAAVDLAARIDLAGSLQNVTVTLIGLQEFSIEISVDLFGDDSCVVVLAGNVGGLEINETYGLVKFRLDEGPTYIVFFFDFAKQSFVRVQFFQIV